MIRLFGWPVSARDLELHANPFDIDIERKARGHLTFGLGPHVWIGLHLARREIRVAGERILARTKRFTLDPEHMPVLNAGSIWCFTRLYIRMEASDTAG